MRHICKVNVQIWTWAAVRRPLAHLRIDGCEAGDNALEMVFPDGGPKTEQKNNQ